MAGYKAMKSFISIVSRGELPYDNGKEVNVHVKSRSYVAR